MDGRKARTSLPRRCPPPTLGRPWIRAPDDVSSASDRSSPIDRPKAMKNLNQPHFQQRSPVSCAFLRAVSACRYAASAHGPEAMLAAPLPQKMTATNCLPPDLQEVGETK